MEKKTDSTENKKTTLTNAEKIWTEIANLTIEMFALPDQKVANYCKLLPKNPDPEKLFLIPTAGSVLPALEKSLGDKFSVEMVDRFLIVSRKINLGL